MSPYKNVEIMDYPALSMPISVAREQILGDISSKEKHMISWYQDDKWAKNKFNFSTIARDPQKNCIALSSCKKMPDNTLKILCHYYVIRRMRCNYPGIAQTDFIPHYLKYARKLHVKGVWFSIHSFSQRQEKHKMAKIRRLNVRPFGLNFQPYKGLFKYMGEIEYNNVMQSKFLYSMK